MFRTFVHTAIGAAFFAIAAGAAGATTPATVNVTLWDKGSGAPMVMDKGIGMSADKQPATMGLKLSAPVVNSGDITLQVINTSRETVHEMVVFPYKAGSQLPYDPNGSKINEDAAGHLGEVSELEPGKSGSLKISLKPGKYVLTCNIPGHYMNGMWALLTVK